MGEHDFLVARTQSPRVRAESTVKALESAGPVNDACVPEVVPENVPLVSRLHAVPASLLVSAEEGHSAVAVLLHGLAGGDVVESEAAVAIWDLVPRDDGRECGGEEEEECGGRDHCDCDCVCVCVCV